jgi:hypothetical protein
VYLNLYLNVVIHHNLPAQLMPTRVFITIAKINFNSHFISRIQFQKFPIFYSLFSNFIRLFILISNINY